MQIKDILNKDIGDTVFIQGWIMTCRKQKNLSFIKCNDGSCTQGIQLILINSDTECDLSLLQTGASIKSKACFSPPPAESHHSLKIPKFITSPEYSILWHSSFILK